MEFPYILYLTFLKPIDFKLLLENEKSTHLITFEEDQIDLNQMILKCSLKSDPAKQIVLYARVDINNGFCSEISIGISYDTQLERIEELFSFLNNFDANNISLIDQELKNELFLENYKSFLTNEKTLNIPEKWAEDVNIQATLSLSFQEFYSNGFKVAKRDKLLGKYN